MNIFSAFTIKSLKKNKVRTIVTIIGIILSVALHIAVLECAYSGINYLLKITEEMCGKFHGVYYEVSSDDINEITEDKRVKDIAVVKNIGYARVTDNNTGNSVFEVKSADNKAFDMMSLQVKKGRYPENNNEIVIFSYFAESIGVDIGDEIVLNIGQLKDKSGEYFDNMTYKEIINEEFVDCKPVKYTIVGLFDDVNCSHIFIPVYTKDYNTDGRSDVLIVLEDEELISEYDKDRKVDGYFEINQRLSSSDEEDTYKEQMNKTIYGMAAIFILLIVFGSVSLIYNAFSISVTERIKQYGMLRSVGATRRQIYLSVLYEAFVLSFVSIVPGIILGCAGSYTALYLLRDDFNLFMYESSDLHMEFIFAPRIVMIAVLLSLLTVCISAYLPARKATKSDPVTSIRQTNDIKVKLSDTKVPPCVTKFFKIEWILAIKNFRRNRKRYRITVLSISMSIILFIASSSFVSYLNRIIAMEPRYISENEKFTEAAEILGNPEILTSFGKEAKTVEDIDKQIEKIEQIERFLQKFEVEDVEYLISEFENIKRSLVLSKKIITIVEVLCYCFIIIITVISIANVFNTISTNINLRRREFAMLKSVGLSERQMKKMMNAECIVYGIKSLMLGFPIAIAVTYFIYVVCHINYEINFYIPFESIAIVALGVFPIVYLPMIYSASSIKKANCVDELRNENI